MTAAALEEDGVIVKLNALNEQYSYALNGNSLLVDNYKELAAEVVEHIDSYYDYSSLSRDIKPDNPTLLKVAAAYIFVNNMLVELDRLMEEKKRILVEPGAVIALEIPGFDPGAMVDIGAINARTKQLNSLYGDIAALYAKIR